MSRNYAIYDVFTRVALAGNPLAIVYDATDLTTERMQAIAQELNLSETVFVLPAEQPAHTAKIRIFTPGRELPFAGHPTVGTAIALAEARAAGQDIDLVTVLEENVGSVRAVVRLSPNDVSFAEFDLPKVAVQAHVEFDVDKIADALCINSANIGFENHRISLWDAGVPFIFVPIRDRAVAAEIEFNPLLWKKAVPANTPVYVYCRGGDDHSASFHARMFSPDMGIAEDPATGGAVAAMSGAIVHFDQLQDGSHALMIEQGVEMGRPSYIHLHLEIEQGIIAKARIGGHALRIGSGTLEL